MTWLHLSDIHHQFNEKTLDTKTSRGKLISYLEKEEIKAEHLFITGDFRFGSDQSWGENGEKITALVNYIIAIADAAGVKRTNIHYVPGNHDIVRYSEDDVKRLNTIRKDYDPSKGFFEYDEMEFLISSERYSFFKQLSTALAKEGIPDVWVDAKVDAKGDAGLHVYQECDDFNLISLNTSLFCHSREDDERGLLVGCSYLYDLLGKCNSEKPIIILAHHRLDFLRKDEEDKLHNLLKDYPQVSYLCGDAHKTSFRKINHVLEITMGSMIYEQSASLVFSQGEVNNGTVSSIVVHSWAEGRWGLSTHHNKKLEDILGSKAILVTTHEHRRFLKKSSAFIGRENEIENIENQLLETKPLLLVSGIGGMGKTEICHQLAHRYITKKAPSFAKKIGWIYYTGNLKSSFFNNFIDISSDSQEEYWQKSVEFINSRGDSLLLIIDNANDLSSDDVELIEELNCNLLLTSRNHYESMTNISLGVLSDDDCLRLYRTYSLDKNSSDEDIINIIQRANRHTLAVELLAKTQKSSRVTANEFLDKLIEQGFQLPDITETINYSKNGESRFIEHLAKVFDISQLCEDAEALRILQLFSLLQGNIPIATEYIKVLFDITDCNKINKLVATGWLQNSPETLDCSIHPIIAAVVREKAMPDEAATTKLVQNMTSLLRVKRKEILTSKLALLPHAVALMDHVKYESVQNSESAAQCYNNIALLYEKQGEYEKALEYYKKALNIRKEKLGKEHPDTATIYNNIAVIYHNQGKYGKALAYHTKALIVFKINPGEDHPDTATIYNNIGSIHYKQGEYKKSWDCHTKALNIRKRKLGEDHLETSTCYNDIGLLYSVKGEYKKALAHYTDALNIREKNLGKYHPEIATIYNNIGDLYGEQEEYEKALENHEKALDIREKTLGKEHPDTAISYNNIGCVYDKQGEYKKALAHYTEALNIRKKTLGKEHIDTATIYNNIGYAYSNQGAYEKALENHKNALNIREKTLGEEYPETATSYYNISAACFNLGKYENARVYMAKALKFHEKTFGEDHPDTANTYSNISELCFNLSMYEESLECCEKALNIFEKTLGPAHTTTVMVHNNCWDLKKRLNSKR